MFNLKLNLRALEAMAEAMISGFMLTSGGVAALYLFNLI